MKLSISLPDEDVEFLDEFARDNGHASRSAAMRRAVQLLRVSQLGDAYLSAWDDWARSDDAGAWDSLSSDGLVRPE